MWQASFGVLTKGELTMNASWRKAWKNIKNKERNIDNGWRKIVFCKQDKKLCTTVTLYRAFVSVVKRLASR